MPRKLAQENVFPLQINIYYTEYLQQSITLCTKIFKNLSNIPVVRQHTVQII